MGGGRGMIAGMGGGWNREEIEEEYGGAGMGGMRGGPSMGAMGGVGGGSGMGGSRMGGMSWKNKVTILTIPHITKTIVIKGRDHLWIHTCWRRKARCGPAGDGRQDRGKGLQGATGQVRVGEHTIHSQAGLCCCSSYNNVSYNFSTPNFARNPMGMSI